MEEIEMIRNLKKWSYVVFYKKSKNDKKHDYTIYTSNFIKDINNFIDNMKLNPEYKHKLYPNVILNYNNLSISI